MRLPNGGADVWYIDESMDKHCLVVSAISVPLLRLVESTWHIVWDDHFAAMKAFRQHLRQTHGIPIRKELHAVNLAAGRGSYGKNGSRLGKAVGLAMYRWILSSLGFLQDMSVITVCGTSTSKLYGHKRTQAAMYALFQRMQRASAGKHRAGMTFFDEGHPEYRKLYRQARIFLPTGSMYGGWAAGASQNLPMTYFFKDGNTQNSRHSWFLQVVDLITYAAFMKAKHRLGALTPWQAHYRAETLYDAIPMQVLNRWASLKDAQGIVWL